jgi:hypothetical protein
MDVRSRRLNIPPGVRLLGHRFGIATAQRCPTLVFEREISLHQTYRFLETSAVRI